MRIAIDYRFIVGGPNILNRGTGRFTQQQLREVLRVDAHNEYLLIHHDDAEISYILPEIRTAPNVRLVPLDVPGLKRTDFPNAAADVMRNIARFQDWLYAQNVDVFHETTPYQIDELVLSHFDVCPMVVTLYDLIPMIYPDHYWPWDSHYNADLERALQLMARADRLIAISEATRRDAQSYLGVPRERIDLAYPIADPFFGVLSPDKTKQALGPLRARLEIPEHFMLSVTHIHHSKNLRTLLAAYAQLPRPVRYEYPLVVVFHMQKDDRARLQGWLAEYGLENDVILTGLVSDDELRALLNAATLVVHPSRYEGFGYPVVEAMQCGAPVVTTNTSSLPEVGGQAAILVDPHDVEGMATAIECTLSDVDLRARMRELGLQHVRLFDADQLGRNTLACYQAARAAERPVQPQARVAVWTSLPPLNCGIADYTVELLEHLNGRYDLELFVDSGYQPQANLMREYKIHHYSAFQRRQQQLPFDVTLYQLGISLMHDFMYLPLKQNPGIVVLHDLNYAPNLYHVYRERKQLDVFEREIVAPEGLAAVKEFRQAQRLRGVDHEQAIAKFLETYPLNRWVVTHSLAQIVHMDEAKRVLESRCPEARAFTVLHGASDPKLFSGPNLWPVRDLLLDDPDEFVIGIFGSVVPIKRIDSCLKAFARLCMQHSRSRLVIVGEHMDSGYATALQAQAQDLHIAERVQFLGRATLEEMTAWLRTVDVVLNLRYPPKLQMSGTLCRAIAAGKPLIVSDIPEWRFLPDSFCWRVVPDDQEVDVLTEYLLRLAKSPEERRQRGEAVSEYYHKSGTMAHMAAGYESVIARVIGRDAYDSFVNVPGKAVRPSLFNKVSDLEDFDNVELVGLIREIYPHETLLLHRRRDPSMLQVRFWQAAMAAWALRSSELLNGSTQILTIGAEARALNYYLTRKVAQVTAIDDYLNQDTLSPVIPAAPDYFAPFPYAVSRLTMQSMDLRHLRFADATFDAVVACSPLRVAGDLMGVAQASYELSRVLRPGGLASLQLNLALSGPPGESNWGGNIPLLSAQQIERYIVQASGLELIGPVQWVPSSITQALPRDLTLHPEDYDQAHIRPRHMIQTVGGYVICYLHLCLKKTAVYPALDNAWAKPSGEVIRTTQRRSVATALVKEKSAGFRVARQRRQAPALEVPKPAPLLQLARRFFSERHLAKARDVYRQILDRLPQPLALHLGRLALRVGLVERV